MINTVTNISSSVVRVTWTRPAVLNGILISYTITYVINTDVRSITVDYNGEEVSMRNNVTVLSFVTCKQTQSYDIVGLSPYQLISVTITAITGGGTSGPSEEEFGRSSEAGSYCVTVCVIIVVCYMEQQLHAYTSMCMCLALHP